MHIKLMSLDQGIFIYHLYVLRKQKEMLFWLSYDLEAKVVEGVVCLKVTQAQLLCPSPLHPPATYTPQHKNKTREKSLRLTAYIIPLKILLLAI